MLEALLKKLGIAEDVIQKVIKGMSDEKIYTTKEENIEERYTKLKEQKEDVEVVLQHPPCVVLTVCISLQYSIL